MIKEKVNAEVSPSQLILKDELNKIGLFKAENKFSPEVKLTSQLRSTKYNQNNFSTDTKKVCNFALKRISLTYYEFVEEIKANTNKTRK